MSKFFSTLGRRGRFGCSIQYRSWLRGAAFGLSAILLLAHSSRALAEEKIALVIGNSEYRKVERLPNPVNDAADIATSLKRIGFTVTHLSNLDFNGFRKALIEFGKAAKTADKAAIFFAGHGVEIDGKNWLIPVDAEIKKEVDVYAEGINLETLIDISVMPKVVGLVILDACRNDPFASTVQVAGRSVSGISATEESKSVSTEPPRPASAIDSPGEVSTSAGLAPVEVNDNVLVAFAAAAGTTAADGIGRNSPYSGSLLRHLETPGLEINYLFRNVHDDVVRETKMQEPAVYGTLSKEEIFLQGDVQSALATADVEAERVTWTFVRATNEIATLRRFLLQFPSSTHGDEVRGRIAQLEDAEISAWTIVERQKSAVSYRAFLDLYPYSEHVETARATLASLDASGQTSESQPTDLSGPPNATFQSNSSNFAISNSQSIETAWDVLRQSRDQNLQYRFVEKYPSLRRGRLPANSDMALRPVNSTEWMLQTAQDDDVNSCFANTRASCIKAIEKYPDFVQLRFQLCRVAGRPNGCMQDAVEDARQRGFLISAYTRSQKELYRNREYRKAAAAVQQSISNVVGNVVSNVVSSVVSNSVSNVASTAAGNAASSAAASASARAAAGFSSSGVSVVSRPGSALALPAVGAPRAAPPVLAGTGRWDARFGNIRAGGAGGRPSVLAAPSGSRGGPPGLGATFRSGYAPGGAGNAASGAAGRAAAGAAGRASSAVASRAAGHIASHAAGRAASIAAGRAASQAAGRAASNAAGRAASHAASRAASHAASRAASHAASNAASRAAASAASRIPSDIRLKRDITVVSHASGLNLYRFRYIGDARFYVGVMAQEVAMKTPAAVAQSDNGYLEVDYQLLGINFMTYHNWLKQNFVSDNP